MLTRGTSTQAFLTLRDGSAQQANYDLTGEGAQTAELIYVHSDHLSTPRLATNDTQTVAWRWAGEAFGNTAPNEDPDGDGVKTTFNLRFPGQYHDGESGLYYNWNRYYDPGKGRYITSDPIGLRGGGNTYAYALANPLRWFDSSGLQITCNGKWVYKGFNPQLPRVLRLCTCYWLCTPCDGQVVWSGIKESLPSTVGSIYFDPKVRGPDAGDIEAGNACACFGKPGPETNCKDCKN